MNDWINITTFINNIIQILIGLAIIVVGIVGTIMGFQKKWFLKSLYFRFKYPRKKLNKDFELIRTGINSNQFYVIEKKKRIARCIASEQTLLDIGFKQDDVKHNITWRDLDSYTRGRKIYTRGIIGK